MGGRTPRSCRDSVGDRRVVVLGPVTVAQRLEVVVSVQVQDLVPATGAGAAAVPAETQMLLLECEAGPSGARCTR